MSTVGEMEKRFWFMATPVYAFDTRQGAKFTIVASTPTPAGGINTGLSVEGSESNVT